MKQILSILFVTVIHITASAQQLTPNFGGAPIYLDWQRAGYPGDEVPSYSIIKDITAFGADNTGNTSTNASFTSAVNSLAGANGVIYFPPGNYLFTASIVPRSGLIIRGAGATLTTLTFSLPGEGDLIRIVGTAGASTPITSAVSQYGNQVTVTNPALASMGNFVKIYQSNESALINDTWADNAVGQIACVKSKSGNNLTLYTRHRRAIPLAGAPVAQVLNMTRGVGVECLKIKRTDVDLVANQTSNIVFNYAAYCWVKGIDSDSTNFAHISILNSTNIEVTGSYFHGAFSYGSGGVAYGVVCHMTTGDCLIENNIFRNLRHAMLLQAGANGNVYAFNYSLQQKRTELPSDAAADIVLHGNYPYANLLEGNIAQNIGGDASHGKNGAANVFFRNRALHYGIAFSAGSGDSSIVIYNEVTATGNSTIFPNIALGGFGTTGSNTISSKNYRHTSGVVSGSMEARFIPNEVSTLTHFLEPLRPYFFANDLQPMGFPGSFNSSNSIPARDRYLANGPMTFCSNRSRKDSMMPVICNPLSIASNRGYDVHDITETSEFRDNSNCGIITKIVPSGSTPVAGVIKTSAVIETTVPSLGSRHFVKHHYDIQPVDDAEHATASITLYFTQGEFDEYNSFADNDPNLPTGPMDVTGKSNFFITQFHGTGSSPGNYTGSMEIIDIADDAVTWDGSLNLWTVTFDVTGFSGFYAGANSESLPVKIVSFDYVENEERHIALEWKVAEQKDILKYVVERSRDGRVYTSLATVTANDRSSYTYRHTDRQPFGGVSYYRLKIVEENHIEYSAILVVSQQQRRAELSLYPVPMHVILGIRVNDPELFNREATLLTADGRTVKKFRLMAGENSINVAQLANGLYFLRTWKGTLYKVMKR